MSGCCSQQSAADRLEGDLTLAARVTHTKILEGGDIGRADCLDADDKLGGLMKGNDIGRCAGHS